MSPAMSEILKHGAFCPIFISWGLQWSEYMNDNYRHVLACFNDRFQAKKHWCMQMRAPLNRFAGLSLTSIAWVWVFLPLIGRAICWLRWTCKARGLSCANIRNTALLLCTWAVLDFLLFFYCVSCDTKQTCSASLVFTGLEFKLEYYHLSTMEGFLHIS